MKLISFGRERDGVRVESVVTPVDPDQGIVTYLSGSSLPTSDVFQELARVFPGDLTRVERVTDRIVAQRASVISGNENPLV